MSSLGEVQSLLPVPLSWLYLLPAEADNAAGALHALAQHHAAERLTSPPIIADIHIEVFNTPHQIILRQYCTSAEQEVPRALLITQGNRSQVSHMEYHVRDLFWLTAADVTFRAGTHQREVETHLFPTKRFSTWN